MEGGPIRSFDPSDEEKGELTTLFDAMQEEEEADARIRTEILRTENQPKANREPRNTMRMRVSLMTLLSMGENVEEEESVGKEEEEEKEEEEKEEEERDAAAEEAKLPVQESLLCCVCMIRRKGAAFIPCGHTFCRECSKQLNSRRGSCPVCNEGIVDVLHLF